MEKVMLIKKGKREFVSIPASDDATTDQLDAVRNLLECDTVDAIMLPPNLVMWVDDEGRFKDDNTVHTVAYVYNNQVAYSEELSGNILLTSVDQSGATVGFNQEQADMVHRNFRVINTEMRSSDD